ncbi:MAG: hypothetical protein IPF54_03520 [Draconibacterium sp.]|nr:hypothetical protein [Draconibacterium sp.]
MTKPNHTGALKLVAVIIAVLMSHSGAFSGSAGLWYAVSSINSEFASNSNNSGSNDFSNGVLEIKCPENISTYTDINECSADLSNIPHVQVLNGTLAKLTWIMEGATEATSLPYGINQIDHYIFNEGVTIIRYSGVDYTGNTSECSFTVVISDNQAPKMSAPKSISVKCDERIPSPHTTLQAFFKCRRQSI